MTTTSPMSVHDRVAAVLRGEKPDRLPFIDRIDVWYACHKRNGTLPAEFAGRPPAEIHRAIGMGQQKFVVPYLLKLHGVEVIARFNGQICYHETDPCLEFFIKEDDDYKTVEYLIEHAEFVPRFDRVSEQESLLGDIGYVVPMAPRLPFQQVLLEYLGEVSLFYALNDSAAQVERLMTVLDDQLAEILARLGDLPVAYVEFPDNLHGLMTNPRLFARYSLPGYQRPCETLHRQGKKAGSHTAAA